MSLFELFDAEFFVHYELSDHMSQVVDGFQGREYAASSCVAYLVSEGVPVDQAIQFVKEKKPSADVRPRSQFILSMSHTVQIHI